MATERDRTYVGELRQGEPMARHTSWRVGGPADRFYQPRDIEDLGRFMRELPVNEPVVWVGLGSNLLVRDGGIRGTVICTSGMLDALQQVDSRIVRVEAGVSCAKVARFCARCGLAGAEFLAGIPGTFGGALAMNAGAFGGQTWTLVSRVETLDRKGVRHMREPADYSIGYREVRGPAGEWFVAAYLHLQPDERDDARARIKTLLARRGETQPTQHPSGGSVFRNPTGDHAARLIEACGLKGKCIGDACVSDKHANFIINVGEASAADIEALIEEVAATVELRFGIRLIPEVHIVGEAAQ